mgnify:FL=1
MNVSSEFPLNKKDDTFLHHLFPIIYLTSLHQLEEILELFIYPK